MRLQERLDHILSYQRQATPLVDSWLAGILEGWSFLLEESCSTYYYDKLRGCWTRIRMADMQPRTRRYKLPLILGSLCSFCGFLSLMLVWKGQTDFFVAMLIFPVGFATGVAHSANFIGLSQGVDSEDIAIAGSGLYLSSNVGMVAGVSLGNAVYQLSLSRGLWSALQELPDRDTVRCPRPGKGDLPFRC